ncbi:MAG: GTPase Era [Proteobacteria bacterium]|nr:GTPase Era [Pseudomonadota bacterium]MDA0899732.1 GTPase Era [Pseudomonadota bacterium]
MKCGFVTIIGKTNVGKSTFLNTFIGKKVSITSRKSQTTRSNIYAVKNTDSLQAIFIDTPGIHQRTEKAINKVLRKKPLEAINDIDVILYMVSGTKFDQVDQDALNLIKNSTAKKILLINKIDLVADKSVLFEFVRNLEEKNLFESIIPISSEKELGFDIVLDELGKVLPENDLFYPPEGFDFQSINFEISELIREKVIRFLGDELPYETAIFLEGVSDSKSHLDINALIYVAKQSQKKIVIGADGSKIKQIGTNARKELENHLGRKVNLTLWCKVKKNWLDNHITLESLGIKN